MKNIFRLVKGLLPLLGLLLSLSLSAQDIVVKGHVKDATGESVIGANILIKGTSIGTISDVDGNFTLKAATGNVLTVTCIGYKGQEITVTIFSGFVRGKLLDSLIIGILCLIGCTLLKMPYAPLVSLIVGVTNVIPFFGPFMGAVPSAFLILLVMHFTELAFLIVKI